MRFLLIILLTFFLVLTICSAQESNQNPPAKEENSFDPDRDIVRKRAEALEILDNLSKGDIELEEAVREFSEIGKVAIEVLREKKGDNDIAQAAKKSLDKLAQYLIQHIGNDDFHKREKSTELLFTIGETVLPYLEPILSSKNEGEKFFAKRLKQMIEFSISPELYEITGTILANYDSLDWRDRVSAISEIERLSGQGAVECIRKVFLREKSPLVRLHIANSLLRASGWSIEIMSFLKKEGIVKELQVPAITYEVFLSQGVKYAEVGKHNEAIEEFKKALKEYPQDFRANYLVALSYLQIKNYVFSITHYKTCLEQKPEDIGTHYNIACAYSLQGNIDDAFAHLSLAIKYGYNDANHIEEDSDLNNIKSDPRFNELLQQLKNKDKKE
ncbi:MAG: hypothetical protein ABIH42_00880 [Planctomycetota bacterium]